MKAKSISDLIFGLRSVIEKAWEYNRSLYVSFIDLQKALDSIPICKLWDCLDEEYGVTGNLKRVIVSLYNPCICSVRTGDGERDWFEVKTGVKQGSVLSSLLFIAYIDRVIREFKLN